LAKESLGYHELKQHKSQYDAEYFKLLDQRRQIKLQWLMDPSQMNGDKQNNVRCDASGRFKNKKREHLTRILEICKKCDSRPACSTHTNITYSNAWITKINDVQSSPVHSTVELMMSIPETTNYIPIAYSLHTVDLAVAFVTEHFWFQQLCLQSCLEISTELTQHINLYC
jgi:hypothetical protein